MSVQSGKAYPGLGNRSFVFSSIARQVNTFTFDTVEDTGSGLTSSGSSMDTLARASLKKVSPWFPSY